MLYRRRAHSAKRYGRIMDILEGACISLTVTGTDLQRIDDCFHVKHCFLGLLLFVLLPHGITHGERLFIIFRRPLFHYHRNATANELIFILILSWLWHFTLPFTNKKRQPLLRLPLVSR